MSILLSKPAGGHSPYSLNGQTWQELQEREDLLVRVGFVYDISTDTEEDTYNKEENIHILAAAIKKHEGFYPGSVAYDNNNPGNLRSWSTQVGINRSFAVFSSYEVGYKALISLLLARCDRSWTLYQLMSSYAPAGDGNNPFGYATIVATSLGVEIDTSLDDIYCNKQPLD